MDKGLKMRLMEYLFFIIMVLVLVVIFTLLLALPLMWAWNFVMPYVFGLPTISWGHAWCLQLLSTFLIKSYLISK